MVFSILAFSQPDSRAIARVPRSGRGCLFKLHWLAIATTDKGLAEGREGD
ncbi:hypothetical protein JJD41_24085 [Oxynema sp. CENA135]|nr:hypothetical protein [Oxynema sp. CENA135]